MILILSINDATIIFTETYFSFLVAFLLFFHTVHVLMYVFVLNLPQLTNLLVRGRM